MRELNITGLRKVKAATLRLVPHDCSGLTMAACARAGVALPHSAHLQALRGTPVPADLSLAIAGDLVFIAGADGTAAAPGHVGMVIGRTGGRVYLIQAPQDGIPVEITDAAQWAGQIVAVRHLR